MITRFCGKNLKDLGFENIKYDFYEGTFVFNIKDLPEELEELYLEIEPEDLQQMLNRYFEYTK